jgi:hypothetical protein
MDGMLGIHTSFLCWNDPTDSDILPAPKIDSSSRVKPFDRQLERVLPFLAELQRGILRHLVTLFNSS